MNRIKDEYGFTLVTYKKNQPITDPIIKPIINSDKSALDIGKQLFPNVLVNNYTHEMLLTIASYKKIIICCDCECCGIDSFNDLNRQLNRTLMYCKGCHCCDPYDFFH
jgi:hypothetical protein